MFNFGILAVVFVLGGVLVTLALPILLNRIFRWRFARRFERLVEANQVVPILTRNFDNMKARSTLQRKRVTMESLLDAWIGGQVPSSSLEWKPLAAAFISRQDERPVAAAILTNKAQKAEAKLWLQSFYNCRDTVGQSKLQQEALKRQEQQTIADGADAAPTAGKLRFSTLILMPSKLHPRFQSTEAGANTAEKGAGRWTEISIVSPPQGVSPRTLAENFEREAGGPRGSFGNMHHDGLQTLSAMEIGISEQDLDQASDILELVASDDGDARASISSLGEDDELNDMILMLAARTPVSRYPIMYGRPYIVTRPMHMNPLLQTRNRIY